MAESTLTNPTYAPLTEYLDLLISLCSRFTVGTELSEQPVGGSMIKTDMIQEFYQRFDQQDCTPQVIVYRAMLEQAMHDRKKNLLVVHLNLADKLVRAMRYINSYQVKVGTLRKQCSELSSAIQEINHLGGSLSPQSVILQELMPAEEALIEEVKSARLMQRSMFVARVAQLEDLIEKLEKVVSDYQLQIDHDLTTCYQEIDHPELTTADFRATFGIEPQWSSELTRAVELAGLSACQHSAVCPDLGLELMGEFDQVVHLNSDASNLHTLWRLLGEISSKIIVSITSKKEGEVIVNP